MKRSFSFLLISFMLMRVFAHGDDTPSKPLGIELFIVLVLLITITLLSVYALLKWRIPDLHLSLMRYMIITIIIVGVNSLIAFYLYVEVN